MIKSIFGVGRDKTDPEKCVREAVKDFVSPKLILFFSGEENFPEYSRIISGMFPDAVCMGCSTYRTWGPSGTEKDVLKVMGVEEGIIVSGGVIEKADRTSMVYIDNVRKCLDEVGTAENTVCLELTAAFKCAEEYALTVLNSVLLRKGVQVVGGTASNSLAEDRLTVTYVSLNGKIYPDGCVFAIVHNMGGRIYMLRENIYEPLTGDPLLVTKANSLTRTVLAFNNRPAADVYAEQLGVPRDKIADYFFHNPMGRWQGDELYLTAIFEEGSGGSMKNLARVHENTKMMVMKEADYRKISADTVKTVLEASGEPALVIGFHCLARTVFFERNNYIDEYGQLLGRAFKNYIGLSCNGEQQGTTHFNHTLMTVVFE